MNGPRHRVPGEVPRVAVLLGTLNGEKYLVEQLCSLEAQSHPRIDVWASDDGSTDATLAILQDWARRWSKGNFAIFTGPGRGFAENFRTLLISAAIDGDYFAFCDQDDVWEPHKLQLAISRLRECGAQPGLFCSRTRSISEDGREIGYSPLPLREPSFRNAIVQSLAGGNTMVMNGAARTLVADASRDTVFVSHDWWSYQIVSGAGGLVHYDPRPLVRYRQHDGNQIGANSTWGARIHRLKRLFAGQFHHWTDINMAGLQASRTLLTEDSRLVMDTFRKVREGSVGERLRNLRRSTVYRQSVYGTLGLYLAVVLRRI